ncbi:MAG TPA: hypothetical protein VMK84_11025 [Streptosporangiaceae bacterium]|nr:hypothetical protein [Streptosporangiaceae bacterium]
MIDKAALRRMSQADRRELARLLAELDKPAIPASPDPYRVDPALRRDRRFALILAAACSVILACWIVVLAATLPHRFDAHHWRAVWVNFDILLFAAFAATAWAIWRQRQVLILLLTVTGTMLVCDAWFDVGTSLATSSIWISLLSAVFAELPLAFLAFAGARRLLRATVAAGILAGAGIPAGSRAQVGRAAGTGPDIPDWAQVGNWGRSCAGQSLSSTPLAGGGLDEALPRSRAERRAAGQARQPA